MEAERARLTRQLAALLEEEGKVAEACDVIQVHFWLWLGLGWAYDDMGLAGFWGDGIFCQ